MVRLAVRRWIGRGRRQANQADRENDESGHGYGRQRHVGRLCDSVSLINENVSRAAVPMARRSAFYTRQTPRQVCVQLLLTIDLFAICDVLRRLDDLYQQRNEIVIRVIKIYSVIAPPHFTRAVAPCAADIKIWRKTREKIYLLLLVAPRITFIF